jgi:hypothetical protein
MQNYNAGFLPANFTKTTNAGVLVVSHNYIGDDPGAGATDISTLAVQGDTGQTTPLVDYRASNGSTVDSVSAAGALTTPQLCMNGDCIVNWDEVNGSGVETDPVFVAVYGNINTSISGRVPNATLTTVLSNLSGKAISTYCNGSTILQNITATGGNYLTVVTSESDPVFSAVYGSINTSISGRVPNATLATYSTIAYVGNRILNTTVIANHRLNTNSSFPGNISVAENVTAVKCIFFSNGAKMGVC